MLNKRSIRKRRVLGGLLAATVTVGLLTGCGNDGANASGGEGDSIVIYSGRNEKLIKPLIEQFTQATGVKAEVRYADSAAMGAQLLEEGKNTPADVFLSQDAGALGAVSKDGLFKELPKNLLDRVSAALRADDGTWLGVSARARVIAYNSEVVQASQVPTSIWDVTKPEWKGKVGYAPTNASFQSFVTAMRITQGNEKTKQWLTDFKANEPKTFSSNGLALKAVEDKSVSLALVNHYYLYELQAEKGAENVKSRNAFLGNGDPGALVNVAGVGIIKGTKKSVAAQRFVEYLLSTDAQNYFRDKTFEYPVIDGITPSPGLPALDSLNAPKIDLSDLDSLAETQQLMREVGLI